MSKIRLDDLDENFEMATCPKCGAELEPGEKHCPVCAVANSKKIKAQMDKKQERFNPKGFIRIDRGKDF